jgi:hypothetical protein
MKMLQQTIWWVEVPCRSKCGVVILWSDVTPRHQFCFIHLHIYIYCIHSPCMFWRHQINIPGGRSLQTHKHCKKGKLNSIVDNGSAQPVVMGVRKFRTPTTLNSARQLARSEIGGFRHGFFTVQTHFVGRDLLQHFLTVCYSNPRRHCRLTPRA